MENFISTIRTDRFREMKEYDDKGYFFIDRQAYRKIDKITTRQEGYEMTFGVEATQNDVYFYLINNQANTYLSIYEIYQLLLAVTCSEGEDFVVNALKQQLRLKIRKSPGKNKKDVWLNQEKFEYCGIEYDIRKTVELGRKGEVGIPDISLEITYKQLFLLINLIQEKSNALFLRGKQNRKYADGILRLFVVLLCVHKELNLLTDLGWSYNAETDGFLFEAPKEENQRNKRKYYLTKKEYDNIMK